MVCKITINCGCFFLDVFEFNKIQIDIFFIILFSYVQPVSSPVNLVVSRVFSRHSNATAQQTVTTEVTKQRRTPDVPWQTRVKTGLVS